MTTSAAEALKEALAGAGLTLDSPVEELEEFVTQWLRDRARVHADDLGIVVKGINDD